MSGNWKSMNGWDLMFECAFEVREKSLGASSAPIVMEAAVDLFIFWLIVGAGVELPLQVTEE